MTTIHMNTDIVQDTANQIDRVNEDLYFKPRKIRNAANTLQNSWQGGNSANFVDALSQAATVLQEEVINLQRLAQRVRREIGEWESADQFGATSWGNVEKKAVYVSQAIDADNALDDEHIGLKLGSLIGDSVSYAGDVLEYGKELSPGGYVGKMENLGKLANGVNDNAIKTIGYVGGGLSFAFGVAQDLSNGNGVYHAVISEGLEIALHFVPGISQVLLVYDGVILAGDIAAGGLEVVGLHDWSRGLQNAVDSVDIVEHLTDDIADFTEHVGENIWGWLT